MRSKYIFRLVPTSFRRGPTADVDDIFEFRTGARFGSCGVQRNGGERYVPQVSVLMFNGFREEGDREDDKATEPRRSGGDV